MEFKTVQTKHGKVTVDANGNVKGSETSMRKILEDWGYVCIDVYSIHDLKNEMRHKASQQPYIVPEE